MIKKTLLFVLCLMITWIAGCDGLSGRTEEDITEDSTEDIVEETPEETPEDTPGETPEEATEALNAAFASVLEGDNYTCTMSITEATEPDTTVFYQKDGGTIYILLTFNEVTGEGYYLTENGERVAYGREFSDGTWFREVDPDEDDFIVLPTLVWDASEFVYEDGVYTLNDDAFEDLFGEDADRENASYTVILDNGSFEKILYGAIDGDDWTATAKFQDIGTTSIELPNFAPTVTFETYSDYEIASVVLQTGSSLDEFIPEKDGYIFMGWYEDDNFENQILTVPIENITVHANWGSRADWIMPEMVQVGEPHMEYTVPTETDDSETTTVTGGYLMATTQTTYELWYEVRTWAEANGYHFQNFGLPGSRDSDGNQWWVNFPSSPPAITDENANQPVTWVSWRDVIVWLNALSEMKDLDPVYRSESNHVIRDSRAANADVVDAAIQTASNGYRLPTSDEWEMAARWKNDTESTDGSILVGGRYWTPGNYASGATDDYNNEEATRLVAHYLIEPWHHPDNHTIPVAQLLPNHLGIYDMSGNVQEWTYTIGQFGRIVRGGGWNVDASDMWVGGVASGPPYGASDDAGFRFVRNP